MSVTRLFFIESWEIFSLLLWRTSQTQGNVLCCRRLNQNTSVQSVRAADTVGIWCDCRHRPYQYDTHFIIELTWRSLQHLSQSHVIIVIIWRRRGLPFDAKNDAVFSSFISTCSSSPGIDWTLKTHLCSSKSHFYEVLSLKKKKSLCALNWTPHLCLHLVCTDPHSSCPHLVKFYVVFIMINITII